MCVTDSSTDRLQPDGSCPSSFIRIEHCTVTAAAPLDLHQIPIYTLSILYRITDRITDSDMRQHTEPSTATYGNIRRATLRPEPNAATKSTNSTKCNPSIASSNGHTQRAGRMVIKMVKGGHEDAFALFVSAACHGSCILLAFHPFLRPLCRWALCCTQVRAILHPSAIIPARGIPQIRTA